MILTTGIIGGLLIGLGIVVADQYITPWIVANWF